MKCKKPNTKKTFKEIIKRILATKACNTIDVFDARGKFIWRCTKFHWSDEPTEKDIFMLLAGGVAFEYIRPKQLCTVTKRGLSVISFGKRVYLRFYELKEIVVD